MMGTIAFGQVAHSKRDDHSTRAPDTRPTGPPLLSDLLDDLGHLQLDPQALQLPLDHLEPPPRKPEQYGRIPEHHPAHLEQGHFSDYT